MVIAAYAVLKPNLKKLAVNADVLMWTATQNTFRALIQL
jgi:hypothetical protein